MAFLTKLLRRFKTDSIDLSLDFSGNFDMKEQSIKQTINTFKNLEIKGDFVEYNQSFYINNTKYKQLTQLNRLILYDKFYKQKNYHKQNINEKFCKWKRLELRLNIKNKLLSSLDVIKGALKLFSLFLKSINNQNITRKFLNYQFSVFKDLRKNKHIKAINLL